MIESGKTKATRQITYEDIVEAGPSGLCQKKAKFSQQTVETIKLKKGLTSMKTIGSWIVVEFEGKKNSTHFIGQITSIQRDVQTS